MLQGKRKSLLPKFSDEPCVLLAAGGTGGHLLPAQMTARGLLERNCRVVFAGKGLAGSGVFDQKEFTFYEIQSSTIASKNPVRVMRSLFLLCKGVWESMRLLSFLPCTLVVGFGSYHSFPLLFAAWWKKIPILIFQPDRTLGKVNRFFAKKARLIALQFPLEKDECDHVAYVPLFPWNAPALLSSKNEAREQLHLKKDCFTLLVFGGSQGAHFINEAILKVAELLQKRGVLFQIIHLTGEDPQPFSAFYQSHLIPSYVKRFEKDMTHLFFAADLAICRAGASSCGELISFELPYLLIPYPYAGGHQKLNALYLQNEVKGGEMLLQENVEPKMLTEKICQRKESLAYHREKIQEFKRSHSRLKPKKLCDIICEISKERGCSCKKIHTT